MHPPKVFKSQLDRIASYPYVRAAAPIKLDQNEALQDFPDELKVRALERTRALGWNRYPELHAETVRAALARHEQWPEEGIVLSPGANHLVTALTGAAERVVDVVPSFALFESGARLAATPYLGVPLAQDFVLPLDDLLNAMRGPPGVLFLTNPHAPTGVLFDPDDLTRLAKQARRAGWLLVIDEVYQAFAGSDARRLARDNLHVALIRSFSKAWCLAGIRAGYLLASPAVSRVVEACIPPFSVGVHATATLLSALEAPGYVSEHVARVRTERERLLAALRAHPSWIAYPSSTNFLLIRTPDAGAAVNALRDQGILVRRQDSGPGLEGCIRATVGTRGECDALIRAAGLQVGSPERLLDNAERMAGSPRPVRHSPPGGAPDPAGLEQGEGHPG